MQRWRTFSQSQSNSNHFLINKDFFSLQLHKQYNKLPFVWSGAQYLCSVLRTLIKHSRGTKSPCRQNTICLVQALGCKCVKHFCVFCFFFDLLKWLTEPLIDTLTCSAYFLLPRLSLTRRSSELRWWSSETRWWSRHTCVSPSTACWPANPRRPPQPRCLQQYAAHQSLQCGSLDGRWWWNEKKNANTPTVLHFQLMLVVI